MKIDKYIFFSTNIDGTITDEQDKIYSKAEFEGKLNDLRTDSDINWHIILFLDEEPEKVSSGKFPDYT